MDPSDATAPDPAPDPALDPALDAVMSERRQLLNLCYRMLGSLAEAEDAVQETYARWYAMTPAQQEAIESPGAWLTRVAGRICLDQLRSARARRERYVGEWLPEPLPESTGWINGRSGGSPSTGDPGDPADRVTLDESISMAFLVVLESMTPAQRVVLILHDVFGYSFVDVAEIVGRTPAACRRLAFLARRRVADAPAPVSSGSEHAEVVRAFKAAWESKDIGALVTLLDPAVTATADGGGLVTTVREPVQGDEAVARALVGVAELAPSLSLLERMVNGQPGLVALAEGVVETVLAFDVGAHGIRRIWAVRNPEKLRPWTTSS